VNRTVIYLCVQPITREQQPVSRHQLELVSSRFNRSSRTDGLQDFVSSFARGSFRWSQLAKFHHAVDQRLVARNQTQLAPVEVVGAAVAYVANHNTAVPDNNDDGRSSHALQSAIGADGLLYRPICLLDCAINGVCKAGAGYLSLMCAQSICQQWRKDQADCSQREPGGLVTGSMSAHTVGNNHHCELVILVQVRPTEVLHKETVFVSAPLSADGSHSGNVETQNASRLWDRLRSRGLGGQDRRLDCKRLAALVALDWHTEVLLIDGAQRNAVRTVGANLHGVSLTRTILGSDVRGVIVPRCTADGKEKRHTRSADMGCGIESTHPARQGAK
jgi:hypothetical protein